MASGFRGRVIVLSFHSHLEGSAFLDLEAGVHLHVFRPDRQLPSGLGREKDVASSGECLAVSAAGSDVFASALDVYRPRLRIPYLAPVKVVNFAV